MSPKLNCLFYISTFIIGSMQILAMYALRKAILMKTPVIAKLLCLSFAYYSHRTERWYSS